MTPELIIGWILSIIGMAVTVCSFQAKTKKWLLILQTVGSAFYLLSYIFLGAGIAVVLNVIYLVRNMLFAFAVKPGTQRAAGVCAALCVACVIGYAVYTPLAHLTIAQNLWNVVPVAGAVFGTIGAASKNADTMRLWKYGDAILWVIFNAYCLSIGGVIGDSLNVISITLGLWRSYRARKKRG